MSSIEFFFFDSTRFIYHDPQNRLSRSWQWQRQCRPTTHQKPPEHFYYLCVCIWERLGDKKFIDLTMYSLCIYFLGVQRKFIRTFTHTVYFSFGWVEIKRGVEGFVVWGDCLRGQKPCFFCLTFVYVHELLFRTNIWRRALLVMKIDLTIKFVRRLRIPKTWEIHHVTTNWPEGEL